MKIVIDIPDIEYQRIISRQPLFYEHLCCVTDSIRNGIQLPKGHGRLIDKDKLMDEMFFNFCGERIPVYDCDGNYTKLPYHEAEATILGQSTIIEADTKEEDETRLAEQQIEHDILYEPTYNQDDGSM